MSDKKITHLRPPVSFGGLLRNVPYSFNNDLTAMEFMQTIYKYLEDNQKLTNEIVDYLNYFIDKFDDKLNLTVKEILTNMNENGEFESMFIGFNDKLNALIGFDLRKMNSVYHSEFKGLRDKVNQYIGFDSETNEFFTTQIGDSADDLLISRISGTGVLIDTMVIIGGGHGEMIGIDRKTNGYVKIWLRHSTSSKLIQFTYSGGTTLTTQNVNSETDFMPTSLKNVGEVRVAYDPTEDFLIFWNKGLEGEIQFRKREDVRNKIDKVIYNFNITSEFLNLESQLMQGYTYYNKKLYWYTGGSKRSQPITTSVWDVTKKENNLEYVNVHDDLQTPYGRNVWGGDEDVWVGGYCEPEGCFIYFNDKTKQVTYGISVSTMYIGARSSYIYLYPQINEVSFWENIRNANTTLYKMINSDGRALSYQNRKTSMNEFVETGNYFIRNSDVKKIVDFPYPHGGFDWRLDVLPKTQSYDMTQVLNRRSPYRNTIELRREVQSSGIVGGWYVKQYLGFLGEYVTSAEWGNVSNIRYAGEYEINVNSKFTDLPEQDTFKLVVKGGGLTGQIIQELIFTENRGKLLTSYKRIIKNDGEIVVDWFK